MTSSSASEFGFLRLDRRKRSPLFEQLYQAVRAAILQGTLKPGCRIPSSRSLMDQLGVSRTTIVTALDRLIAEGYLQSVRGSGTYVSSDIQDERPFAPPQKSGRDFSVEQPSVAGSATQAIGSPEPFCPGEPALDSFPIDVWSRIVRSIWKKVNAFDLSYGDPAGLYSLRKCVAEYLRLHRGVSCDTRQVLIVGGTQQAVDIVSRVLIKPGDQVLFENPGYATARESIVNHGGRICPMEVDDQGAVIRQGICSAPEASLAYVTPSHQYPLGVTMPIERRLELLDWAAGAGGWILEDDYDSEYRYGQQPIPSMQGLDASNRTIYVGSFSKVVFPALGLGYVIAPPALLDAFENSLRLASRPGSQIDQLVLSQFIREGHFSRHLRRMRKIHAERRRVFVEELTSKLSGALTIMGSHAGLHCTALLNSKKSDTRVVEDLRLAGIIARPLSSYYTPETPVARRQKGLVLGFACATPAQIKRSIKTMADVICSKWI